jgi:protein-tyrosine phosphatase
MSRTVLFLCTGNYYRSRFAEHLFNHLAPQAGLKWKAVSRGLSREIGPWKTGPVSVYAIAGLKERGVPHPEPHREPEYCGEGDINGAEVVIALKEAEHRPRIEEQFPKLGHRVEYWHVHDIDVAKPEDALAELEQLVRDLIRRLSTPKDRAHGSA